MRVVLGTFAFTLWCTETYGTTIAHSCGSPRRRRREGPGAVEEEPSARVSEVEARTAQLEGLLDTCRARIGVAVGRLLDRLRGRR